MHGLNARLYSNPITFSLFGLFLVFFFAYAFFNPDFFLPLIFGLMGFLIYLVVYQGGLARIKAQRELDFQDISERINLMQVEIQKERQIHDAFEKRIINYAQLKGLTEHLSMCLLLEDTSKTLSSQVHKLFGNKNTTIIFYLFHLKTKELGMACSQKGKQHINLKSKKGDIFDQWIMATMQSLLIEDIKKEYRFDTDKITTEDERPIRSLMGVPLIIDNRALGILRIDSPEADYFSSEDLRLFNTIGDLGAVAIENAQLYERVQELAIKDSLTGLYLRRYLLERLPEEIEREMIRKNELSFLMIDLDHFKTYNDRFGHIAGDIVLRNVANLLADFFKGPGNLICRYGGEEFSVLLPDCPKEKAMELAESICKKIAQETIILRRQKSSVTVSIGVASFPKDAQIKEELIHKADQALYKAKENGRNRVEAA